jgi:hypothetical protein
MTKRPTTKGAATKGAATKRPTAKKTATKATRTLVTTAPPPAPDSDWYDAAVAEAKRLVAEGKQLVTEANQKIATADRNNWRLGELADQVVTGYGEGRLKNFAAAIGLAHCTVERRRTTYRNWKDTRKTDPGLFLTLSYWVARALEKHPEKERLVKENPAMTKRHAEVLMKEYRDRNPESEIQRHWEDLIKRMGKATADVGLLDVDRQVLLKVVQPTMLSTLRGAGEAWIRLANSFETLFKEPADDEFDKPADAEAA